MYNTYKVGMKKLSIIIINYNTRDTLKECLLNLKDKYLNKEIIVIDNGSKDKSFEMVKEEFKEVAIIQSDNKGLAISGNLGLKKSTGDYLLYLGTDAFPKEGTLEGLTKYMDENLDVGIVTPKLILRDGSLDMDAHRGFPTPWAAITHFSKLNKVFPRSRIFNQYFLGYKDLDKPHEIDLCISHFMLIRKKVFKDIKGWDEDFFVYGEDVDICYRTKKAGWKIMYLPQFTAIHYKGVSVGTRKETNDVTTATIRTKIKMRRHSTAAMKLFYSKHYSKIYPTWLTGLVFLGIDLMEKYRIKKVKT
jgi:GT2 family glycosyltransferase